MPYSAKAVANEFLHLARDEGRKVTPMQLLKLVYFAHGWYLALTNDRLIDERIQAWKYGPVIPSIYHEFKSFGNEPIRCFATECQTVVSGGRIGFKWDEPRVPTCDRVPHDLIRRVWEVYNGYTAIQLSRMTHEPGSPWAETPNREVKGTTIDDEKIRDYFVQLARRNEHVQTAESPQSR